ncbi:hypothetical protein EAE93_10145 [Photorhabdus akhurstii]|nr:hypothetical protein [Photorhabdus akhurstii]PQQ33548.1 hypothetical protein C6H69_10075 [Photorhabdus luminescens]
MRILIKFYLPAICFRAFRLIIILSLFLALSIDQKRFLSYRDNAGNDVVRAITNIFMKWLRFFITIHSLCEFFSERKILLRNFFQFNVKNP